MRGYMDGLREAVRGEYLSLLLVDALDEACAGTDADELLDRRKGRYIDFARTHLQ